MSVTPESVQELLSSEDYGDRLRGINQLRQLDPAIAFEMIQPLAFDSNVRVRYAAVSQFSTLGVENKQKSFEVLRHLLLDDPEPDIKAAAADSLGALKLVAAYPDLAELYHSTSEWLIQFSIIAALGELGEPESFTLLTQALDSPIELVQAAAISSMGELGDTRAIPLIIPFATHSDWQIRYRVVQALHHLGPETSRSTLETLAQDEIEQVASQAKLSLQSA